MRILVVTGRYPEVGAKGDQSRIYSFIRDLTAAGHEVTVLTGAAPSTAEHATALKACATVVRCPTGPIRRMCSAAGALATGLPVQVGWMTTRALHRTALELSSEHDVILATTIRSLRGPLPAPVVIDHVDALSLNMTRRSRGPERRLRRLAATVESRLLRRHEHRAAAWAVAQVVTSAEDAEYLPASPPMTVIPVGFDGAIDRSVLDARRDVHVVLTGNMRYPPNRDAALWLARDVVPLLRARLPALRVAVAGRGAARLPLSAGIDVMSDVPDMAEVLRRCRVAVVPLRLGTGSPFKLLEAAASGAAVVCTRWSYERFSIPARIAETPEDFAAEIVVLLEDEPSRRELARSALAALEHHSGRVTSRKLEEVLAAASRR